LLKANTQKDKQWSTKHERKTKDWATQTPLPIRGCVHVCSRRESSPCTTIGIRRVTKPWMKKGPNCDYDKRNLYNNTSSNVIVKAVSNISYISLLDVADTDRCYKLMFLQFFKNYNIIILQLRCITVETKEVVRMGYNGFFFRIRTQTKALVQWSTCNYYVWQI
jgi:hypothetical protein